MENDCEGERLSEASVAEKLLGYLGTRHLRDLQPGMPPDEFASHLKRSPREERLDRHSNRSGDYYVAEGSDRILRGGSHISLPSGIQLPDFFRGPTRRPTMANPY